VGVIERTWQHLDQIRAGVDVIDELAADLDALDALPYSPQTWAEIYGARRVARLALFSSTHRKHVYRVISEAASYLLGVDGRPVPRGVVLREGDPTRAAVP
jgi:hypothetical protein